LEELVDLVQKDWLLIWTEAKEKDILKQIQDKFVVKVNELPDTIDAEEYMNQT